MKRLIILILLSIVMVVSAEGQGPSRKVRKATARKEKIEEKQKKAYDKAVRKERKRRYKMQTPEVRKRMKESKQTAKKFNKSSDRPLIEKIVRKKNK